MGKKTNNAGDMMQTVYVIRRDVVVNDRVCICSDRKLGGGFFGGESRGGPILLMAEWRM